MPGLSYGLRAKNSSQELRMFIDKENNGEINICITGRYKGEEIQIDFDPLTSDEVADLASFISLKKRKY